MLLITKNLFSIIKKKKNKEKVLFFKIKVLEFFPEGLAFRVCENNIDSEFL